MPNENCAFGSLTRLLFGDLLQVSDHPPVIFDSCQSIVWCLRMLTIYFRITRVCRLREASWPFIPIPQSEDFLAEK
jgi:hypothetical protein